MFGAYTIYAELPGSMDVQSAMNLKKDLKFIR